MSRAQASWDTFCNDMKNFGLDKLDLVTAIKAIRHHYASITGHSSFSIFSGLDEIVIKEIHKLLIIHMRYSLL